MADQSRFTNPLDPDMHMDFFDEKQLSSDIEKVLKLGPDNVEVKEERRAPCAYSGGATAPNSVYQITSSGIPLTQPSGMFSTATYHTPEMSSYMPVWTQPEIGSSSTWRSPPSLSEQDLEMDNVSYMPMTPSLTTIPTPQFTKTPPINTQVTAAHHKFQPADEFEVKNDSFVLDEKLIKFEDEVNISVGTEAKHNAWLPKAEHFLQNQQQQQQAHKQSEAEPAVGVEEVGGYTFEIDEVGEGPLHILSAVFDKTSLAMSLDMIVQCGVLQQCMNLQNKYKQTPLFLAVLQSNIGYVAWLLENGADPNIQGTQYVDRDDYVWRSPLHLAVLMGDVALPMVRLLLTKSSKTNINLLSHGDKLSPLHMALKQHNPMNQFSCRQIILELLDRGADISIRDQSSSKTPCMLVVETRDLQLIQEFLDKFPADKRRKMLQEQTRSGDTCLHLAAGLSRIESAQKVILLRMLVTNGANGNIPNNVKEMPKDFARYEWNQLRKT